MKNFLDNEGRAKGEWVWHEIVTFLLVICFKKILLQPDLHTEQSFLSLADGDGVDNELLIRIGPIMQQIRPTFAAHINAKPFC